MSRRGGSSNRWRARQERDPYVARALREGWRSRAVYKLEEITSREHLLHRGVVCVDLGASPGGWSQLAARLVGPTGRVVAVDLSSMDPIPGVEFLHGDFTDPRVLEALEATVGPHGADVVMCDMAPNISGSRAVDQSRSMALAEEALLFATEVLRPGGDFLVKLFQGSGLDEFVADVRARFDKVKRLKPKASRAASREIYLLARGFSM
jgi:23S rRNA (uridine2552-2'-O)-methyltransferase